MRRTPTVYLDGLSRALCIRPIPAILQRQLRTSTITHTALIPSPAHLPTRHASTSNTQTARFLSENPNQPNQPKLRPKSLQPQFILPSTLPSTTPPPPPSHREFPSTPDSTTEQSEADLATPANIKKTTYSPAQPLAHLRFILDQLLYPKIFVECERLVNVHGYTPNVELYEILIEACARFPKKRLGNDENGFKITMLPMAWRFFQEMKARGLTPSNAILHHLLRLLADSPDWIKRYEVLQEMKERWYTLSTEGEMWVLEGLFASEQFEEGLAMLWKLRKEGTVRPETVEYILMALCRAGEADEIVEIIKDKELVRREISLEVWEACLQTAANTMNGPATAYIFSQITLPTFCPNFTPSPILLHDILRTCSRTGFPTLASKCITLLSTLHSQPASSQSQSYLFSAQLASRAFSPAFITLSTMLSSTPPLTLTPETITYTTQKLAAMGKSTLSAIKEILLSHQRKFLLNSLYPLNFLLLAYSNLPKQALKHTFHFYKSISADFNIRPDYTTFLILFLTASRKIHKRHVAAVPGVSAAKHEEALAKKAISTQQHLRFCRYLYAEMLETKGMWVSPEIWTLVVGIFAREGELVDVVKVLRGFAEWNRMRLEEQGMKNEVRVGLTDELGRRVAALIRVYENGEGEELPEEIAVPEVVERPVEMVVEGAAVKESAGEGRVESVEEKVARRKGKLGWVWALVERKESIQITAGDFGALVSY